MCKPTKLFSDMVKNGAFAASSSFRASPNVVGCRAISKPFKQAKSFHSKKLDTSKAPSQGSSKKLVASSVHSFTKTSIMQKEDIPITNRFLSLQDLQADQQPDDNAKSHEVPLKLNILNKKQVHPLKRAKSTVSTDPIMAGADVEGLENPIVSFQCTEADKYSLGLTSIAKRCERLKRAKSSVKNRLFLQQNKELYGYIPVNGLPTPVSVNTRNRENSYKK